MKTTKFNSISLAALVLLSAQLPSLGQGTLTRITFDGYPYVAPNTATLTKQYSEAGIFFSVVKTNQAGEFFTRNGGGVATRTTAQPTFRAALTRCYSTRHTACPSGWSRWI